MLRKGGFRLTQWLSSSRELLSLLPSSDIINPNMDLDNEPLPVERTLGVFYDAERDCFCFRVNPDAEANTKRQMLSSASSVRPGRPDFSSDHQVTLHSPRYMALEDGLG